MEVDRKNKSHFLRPAGETRLSRESGSNEAEVGGMFGIEVNGIEEFLLWNRSFRGHYCMSGEKGEGIGAGRSFLRKVNSIMQ